MDIQDNFDRLIVCVHHPRNDENAGMDLYDTLQARQVSYDELDAAVLDEYLFLGRRTANVEKICRPNGFQIFKSDEKCEINGLPVKPRRTAGSQG